MINYMSATLDLNATRLVSWKGLTIKEINSKIIKNEGCVIEKETYLNQILLNYQDVNYYLFSSKCNSKTSFKIDVINAPGGVVSNSTSSNTVNSIFMTSQVNVPNNSCEYPGTCNKITSPVENAKKACKK